MYYKGICCDHCNHWVHHTCNALNYLNETALRSIDYAIFQSLPSYICTSWDQNIKYNIQISILQRKAMRTFFNWDSLYARLNSPYEA